MIDLNNVSFHYNKNDWLFRDMNLSLDSGRIIGLLGKNGVGKTTLMRLFAGLLFPKMGDCNVLNFQPRQRLPEFLQEIFFLPEEFYLPALPGKQYMELYSPFYPRFNRELFYKILQELEVTADKKLTEISYGQKKKFLLAFALATDCKILFLDEPTNGLDIPSKSQFRKLMIANLAENKTFVIATHQVRDLENVIDTVVILANGKIVFNQKLENIAEKLAFTAVSSDELNKLTDICYQEKILGGYQIIQAKQFAAASTVNLEQLFNAVITNPDKFSVIFK